MNDKARRIKEKNMDLIDREFLLFELDRLQTVPKWVMLAVTEIIDEMPKEYPPEGYWIETDRPIGDPKYGINWYECSDCGAYAASNDYNYCHNCGTRMVKDEN